METCDSQDLETQEAWSLETAAMGSIATHMAPGALGNITGSQSRLGIWANKTQDDMETSIMLLQKTWDRKVLDYCSYPNQYSYSTPGCDLMMGLLDYSLLIPLPLYVWPNSCQ